MAKVLEDLPHKFKSSTARKKQKQKQGSTLINHSSMKGKAFFIGKIGIFYRSDFQTMKFKNTI
jgi:hypothetical protein